MNAPMNSTLKRNIIITLIHITAWSLLCVFPLIIFQYNGIHPGFSPIPFLSLPVAFIIAFYINYFILIDRFLFSHKTGLFIIFNLVIILLLGTGLHYAHEIPHLINPPEFHETIHKGHPKGPGPDIFTHDMISLLFFIGLSIALKTVMQWRKLENRNRDLEQKQAEAELKNLKNQLNPHFLFNTLNNIYALIAVNKDKAQEAVLELSRLLRYVLYENKERYVPVGQELNFLKDYIALMRLRQNKQTHIEVSVSSGQCSNCRIAPLLFIPLIENAFKHGINPIGESFIHIVITSCGTHTISCTVENSYFPKNNTDRSGSGIGLDNLRRQLQLLYPDKHSFTTVLSGETYKSTLTINLDKNTEL